MSKDLLQRFIFEQHSIRGAWVRLNTSIEQLHARQQNYPRGAKILLNECLAASVLLSSVIKFDGRLSLQARGDGLIKLLMAETLAKAEQDDNAGAKELSIRGIIRLQADATGQEAACQGIGLLGAGQLVVSIEPKGANMYQSYVSLENDSLAQNLQSYFTQSEQLETSFYIAALHNQVVAMMIQRMPASADTQALDPEIWQHCLQLMATISDEELLATDASVMLYRLFNQQQVRLFDPQAISFDCGCSRRRTAAALKSIGKAEVLALLKESPIIEMDCQFCGQQYSFEFEQAVDLFDDFDSQQLN